MEKQTFIPKQDELFEQIFQPPEQKYLESLAEECIQPLYRHYFRVEQLQLENIPPRRGLEGPPRIFIANHSGMAFPWDAMMLGYGLGQHLRESEQRRFEEAPRSIAAPALSHMPQMAPYFLPGWWRKGGAVDATFNNFDALLSRGYDVIIYPEGIAGIGKGFNKRYQLQRFSTSVVKMSLKHNAKIVPICVINGEYINPFAYSLDVVNKAANAVGIPYIPIGPLTILAALFPFMFYAGLPAKLYMIYQKPISIKEMVSYRDYEEVSEEEFRLLAHKLKRIMQVELYRGVKKYGQKPFHFMEFLSHLLWKAGKQRKGMLPFLWPDLFQTQWHRYHGGDVGAFRRFLRTLPYLTPGFGWLFLLWQNWPRISQKAKTIKFALRKGKRTSPTSSEKR
ncbi:MAG: hypothetical protein D6805_07745 [Planctomycetota bacterium]|nr:MAG: hypothetical protein D6805_07745 [Planctomycetota bacterium]